MTSSKERHCCLITAVIIRNQWSLLIDFLYCNNLCSCAYKHTRIYTKYMRHNYCLFLCFQILFRKLQLILSMCQMLACVFSSRNCTTLTRQVVWECWLLEEIIMSSILQLGQPSTCLCTSSEHLHTLFCKYAQHLIKISGALSVLSLEMWMR